MAYLLTGDKKYVDAAWVQMEEICSWQDWNPNHYLDTSEMSAGVAVGYDWMYDAWTPEQRKHIEEGIYRNGLAESELWQYGAKGSPTRWSMANNNWNLVCNGSITIAALGLMDVYPDLCSRLIQNTYRGTESMMFHFAPDGAWFEGPGYWSYTLQYVSRMMAASDGVLGTCYRLSECEGLNTTADFILHMQSNIGSYNFADADVGKVYPESLYWLCLLYTSCQHLQGCGVSFVDIIEISGDFCVLVLGRKPIIHINEITASAQSFGNRDFFRNSAIYSCCK